jgi:hypothetical protein
VNWPIILTILGSFAAGCGVTLFETGAIGRKSARIDRLADPALMAGEAKMIPCPGPPKCDLGHPHVHSLEVVEYIDDVIEGESAQ